MDRATEIKLNEIAKIIGNTPVINMGEGIYGKLEGQNPAGSIKDRAAYYIIRRALESGELKESGTVVEATSGNTGIGLAYVARELGLHAVMVMPESMSAERRKMIADYGAEVVLTSAKEGMTGSVREAMRIRTEQGAFLANQFGNRASVEAHYYTTAPELFSQIEGVSYVVIGVGSGGTAMGFKKYIEDNGLKCKVVAVEPLSSPLMSRGKVGTHKIQGIGANFMPDLVQVDKLDMIMTVSDEDALKTPSEIYKKFGVKVGISAGAAYFAAKKLRKETEGNIAVILADNGDRYDNNLYK